MKYDIDYDYEFETDDFGTPFLPSEVKDKGKFLVFPNGKYLPPNCYLLEDGSSLIYEPVELTIVGELLARIDPNAEDAEGEEDE